MQDGGTSVWGIYAEEVTTKAKQGCEHAWSCSSCASKWDYQSQPHSTIPLLQVTILHSSSHGHCITSFTQGEPSCQRAPTWIVLINQTHFNRNMWQLYNQHCQEVCGGDPSLKEAQPRSQCAATFMLPEIQQLSSSDLAFVYAYKELSAVE